MQAIPQRGEFPRLRITTVAPRFFFQADPLAGQHACTMANSDLSQIVCYSGEDKILGAVGTTFTMKSSVCVIPRL